MTGVARMKNARKDLGIMALIAGAGVVGVLATVLVLVAIRGPSASPEPTDARQQAVEELSARLKEVSEDIEVQRVRVPGTASATGEGVAVRIRGSVSLGVRAEPIIYIDGVRVDGDRDEALEGLEPDQIDRVEVLKGDAAKELYGSEARNGVIQIVTKSKEGS
jgi:outer membrane receptor for ferrienterochelin and colicin